MISNNGIFVNFEGIDGAGKSTHISLVKELFESAGYEVVTCREPGGTKVGEALRSLLLHEKMNLETEALLMFASRRELLSQVIEPALARGCVVVSDRFTDSSYAFQVGGRQLPLSKMKELENWVHPNLQPDLTLLFDAPVATAQGRISTTRQLDKFESERQEFHENARTEYLRRATESPKRFRIIDSTKTIAEIRQDVTAVVENFIERIVLSAKAP